MPVYRLKSDILGVDFGVESQQELTERDYFDILKTKVQPQDLLHAYKSAPYEEKRQNLATKALDNGFFDQDVGFIESVAEVGGMVGQGIGDLLTTNVYATSRLLKAQMDYGVADNETAYQPLIEEGIKKAGQQFKGLAYAAKRTDRSIEDDLSQAMQFAGIPRDDENLKKRVIAEAQRQDQSQVAATQAQMGVEAAGMMAMIGAKGNEVIERVMADSSKESKLAQIEYLADKFDIAEKIEKGAELGLAEAGLLGTLTNVYLGKNLSPFDVNQEALQDVQSGLVEPDREVALVGSVVADPSFIATMGAAGGVNAMRNVLARGMVIRSGEKAAQESSLRLFLSRANNIAKPSTQQKALIKSAEQKLAKVAGSGEKLDKLVAKSQGVAQAKVGSLIQSGEASTQSGARLVNSLSKALENAPAPKAPIFNRMTGKILERAGMTTETLGRTIEFIQRLPEETLTTLFMKTGGMSQEAALTAARGTARTLQTGAAAGVLTGGFNEFSPELENLGLALLLAPGGSSLITRFGHDAAILGKQLQFAQASSPLFQRIAQLDPADASLTSVIIDRSSALTLPETISGLAEGIFSKSRQFGPSPALKVPSTVLAKTGLGNTLTGAVNTAKTVVGASTIPGAIGYALDGEAGAGGAIGASWPFLAAGLGMGTLVKFGTKSDLYMKMAGDEAYFKDTYLDGTDRASYESQPRIVRQAIATSNIQNPDVIFRFKEGKPPPGESSNFSVENGESVITIYGKSHPQEVLSAIFGHEIAHHIDTFGFMPQIIEQLIGSVEKGKPGVYTEYKNGKPVINKDAEGREVYATNKEFQKHRQQYLDRLEAGGIKKGTDDYNQYANNDAQIAREIFAAHGADWYFGGEFVNKNWQGAGAKMMGAMLDPLFGSTGLKKFFHRIGLATSEETGLVADPTGLFPGLKEVPALTRMIEKYNSDVRGYGPQARREGRGRGNLVDPAFKDELATVNLTAKDLENPAIVNRLKAGGVVKIKDDGTIETDVQGRPVFLPAREVNKNNKKLSNDILEIIRKKEDAGETFGEGHVSLEKTVDGRDRATGVFIDPSIIDQLQGKYNPHQLAALKQINQTLRNGTGDVWDLFYYSALKYNKAGRKVYGQIKGGDRSSLPFGIEITKDGNINIQTISMNAFIKNLEWFAKSKGYSQKMAQAFGGMNPTENTQAALKLLPKYLQNHLNKIENGTPESGITVAQRDLINGAIGRMNADQVKANPVLEGLGDRRSQRQQSYRSRRLDRIGNAVRGEPGYPAVKSAIEQNKLPMRIPAFHGTPHTLAPEAGAPLGKFRTSKIGTGEGAQAYGHGLYFAGKREVAEHYRNALSSDDKLSAKAVKKYAPRKREIEREIRKVQDKLGQATTPQIAQEKARRIKPFEAEINSINAKIRQESADGSLYKVELAPKDSEYLLYDKTLGEQPKGVQDKLKKFLREQEGEDTWQYRQEQDYRDITNNVLDDMPEAEISKRLKEAGIPGIKYLDGSSRNKATFHITPPNQTVSGKYMVKGNDYNSKGKQFDTKAQAEKYLKEQMDKLDYNYVIFDEADVTVTEKLFMPASEAGATKGKQAEAAKLWNEKGTDSPYFKKWFDKSKVVDENGDPLVVYHGTTKREAFTEFKRQDPSNENSPHIWNELGLAFFSDSPEVANKYTFERSFNSNADKKQTGRILPIYLQVKNPKKISYDALGTLESKGEIMRIKQAFEDQGHDGFMLDRGNGFDYVPFSPEQIKSATGNRGTFDAGERNILFMPASEAKNPKSGDMLTLDDSSLKLFLPSPSNPNASLSEFKGKNVQVLTSDLSVVGNKKADGVDVVFTGGPGYLSVNDAWGFTNEGSAKGFKTRWENGDRPLVGITSMKQDNHKASSLTREYYVRKFMQAINEGKISENIVNRHIRAALKRAIKGKGLTDNQKAALKTVKTIQDFLRVFPDKELIPWKATPIIYDKLNIIKDLPITQARLKKLGLDTDTILRETRQPEYNDIQKGSLLAIAEYDGTNAVYRPDLNTAYPWSIPLKEKAFLKEFTDIQDLSSRQDLRGSDGEANIGVAMGAGVMLDKLSRGDVNFMPSDSKAPKAQPANRIQQQAPSMPGNRFMAPAASAGAKLSERFNR